MVQKTRTKNRNSRAILRSLDINILFCIAMGTNTNKQLHAKLKKRRGKRVPKSTISDHTRKLNELGLIKTQKLFNLREFFLTDQGKLTISEIMARGQGLSLGLPVRGHAFGFICEIKREPKDLRDRLKKENWVAYYPKNRVAYKQRWMGCMVIFNPHSVQFMPPEIYAPSQDGAFDQAWRLVQKVKEFLENEEFEGLVLGSPQQVARVTGQHYARPFDPLAVEYYKNSLKTGVRSTYRSDRFGIDLSLGLPEAETLHKVHSKDDLAKITEFYERLIRSELTFDDLEMIRHEIPSYFNRLMDSMVALPSKLEPIATSFEKSMNEHMKIIGFFRDESEKRSEVMALALNRLTEAITKLSKRRRRRRKKPKPKPQPLWKRLLRRGTKR